MSPIRVDDSTFGSRRVHRSEQGSVMLGAMGMSAEVLGIGPFRHALVPYLRHPAHRYAATREGAIIVEVVCATPGGTARSHELARCFGVDPWNFGEHAVDPWRVDLAALRDLFASEPISVERLLALREAEFRFFFRPNG